MADPKKVVQRTFDKALMVQAPLARKNVERLRRVHPHKSPAKMIKHLDRWYLSAVTTSGAAAGGAAVVPGAGVPAAMVDVVAFLEATTFYVLSVAEIHGLHAEDFERRSLLVKAVLVGDSAVGVLEKVVGRTGKHWGKQIVKRIPMAAVNRANKVLGPRFVTKYGTKQGILVLGKQVPLGIGALLGGGGNHLVGRGIIKSTRKILGDVANEWPEQWGPIEFEEGSLQSAEPA